MGITASYLTQSLPFRVIPMTIHAGEFLQGIESGERYIVEYQVAITDEALIGKEIENEVVDALG